MNIIAMNVLNVKLLVDWFVFRL